MIGMARHFMLIVLCVCMQGNIYAQVLSSKYDTKNHPKAKGIWATIRYPAGWESKEGERPNIVQKFTGDYHGMFVVLVLQINNFGGPAEAECAAMPVKDFADMVGVGSGNMVLINGEKITHENKPAFIYDVHAKQGRAGLTSDTYSKVMAVCYKKTLLQAWCSPMHIEKSSGKIWSSLQDVNEVKPLCFQFFNSLVLMDQY